MADIFSPKNFRLPKSRRAWWQAKIKGNRQRDLRHEAALQAMGWHVLTIWECALTTASARDWLRTRLPELLEKQTADLPAALPRVAEDTPAEAGAS